MSSQGSSQRIMKLDESVVNRIAAGEVVQRPANAMKEMLENSLDAGSTSVTVSCKAGGIKLLQIQDNGSGIKPEDFGLLCERFATSKLRSFEDLSSIATFGFRGEALASISHVAHLRVISMTADSSCAYKAAYEDGKMVGSQQPTPCAGVKGTTITVEDLFYNTPLRLKAMRNPSDEYQKIVEVMTKYALHNSGVAMVCKKHGENTTDVRTAKGATVPDNIKALYGHAVARELIQAETKDETYGLTDFRAWFTNPNFNLKKTTFIIFINNRLVECAPLKKAVDGLYAQYLPKGSHPWVYMALQIKPQNIDVNVHPTKSEVRFLYESNIIECVQKLLSQKLEEHNSSRTFSVAQDVLAGAALQHTPTKARSLGKTGGTQSPFTPSALGAHSQSFSLATGSSQKAKSSLGYVSQSKMVRVDPNVRTLDAYLSPNVGTNTQQQKMSVSTTKKGSEDDNGNSIGDDDEDVRTNPSTPMKSAKSISKTEDNEEEEDVDIVSQISTGLDEEDDGGVWNKRRRMALNNDDDDDDGGGGGNDGTEKASKYPTYKKPRYTSSVSDRSSSCCSPRKKDSCKILGYDESCISSSNATQADGIGVANLAKDFDSEGASTEPQRRKKRKEGEEEEEPRNKSADKAVEDEEKEEKNDKEGEEDEDEEEISIRMPRRRPRKFKACPLTSVVTQINSFEAKSHKGLEGVLSNCVFVGFADTSFVVLQERTGLYICNVLTLIQELLFQQVYMRFQNFERIVLKPPLGLRDMLKEAERTPCLSKLTSPVDLDWCYSTIMRMREMLAEYFSIEIDENGLIKALPQIIDSFVPDMVYLPLFVYGLATKVEWQYEHECFETIARQLSEFYVPKPPTAPQSKSGSQHDSSGNSAASSASSSQQSQSSPPSSEPGTQERSAWQKTLQTYEWTIQHMLFPSVKTLLYPPTSYASDGTFVQIAALENLYKVFERC